MPQNTSQPDPPAVARAATLFRESGGTVTASQARVAGIHPRTLAAMQEAGTLVRVSRGVYQLSDTTPLSDPDLAVVAVKTPSAVVCLISALAFHEATTQIPHWVDLALAPGARTPKLEHPPIRVYRFGGRSLTEGVEERDIGGIAVRVFSLPKTIADCFKFRNKIGTDVAIEALRNYLRSGKYRMDDLLRFADINRVRRVMMPYIEATLG